MLSKKEVLRRYPKRRSIVSAVLRQLGDAELLTDIYIHGIMGGYSGFIYYADTVKFARKHKKAILNLLNEVIDGVYISVIHAVLDFGCLKGRNITHDEVGEALYGKYNEDLFIIYNALAWFAAEEVATMFNED